MKNDETPSRAVITAFSDWALARRGLSNPEKQTNPVWVWLAETRFWPHEARELVGESQKQEPGWCFSRYGQSETLLEDGRTVCIGGEHEDFYDPDFFIYNDVTIFEKGRAVEVFGYPAREFPPTDFHSATLIDGQIIIIGRLGYPEGRSKKITPVFILRLDDFTISELQTSGQQPAWMHEHSATLEPTGQSIICEGGLTIHHGTGHYVENIASWRLCLASGTWSKISEKPWSRWLLMRGDESRNELWELSQVSWMQRTNRDRQSIRKILASFSARGHQVDTELYEARYAPNVDIFEIAEDKDDYRTHHVSFGNQSLRFVEQYDSVLMTCESDLGIEDQETLVNHYVKVFGKLEGVPYKAEKL